MSCRISIIIIVKNDRGIADTLTHLARQQKPAQTEVLVVDASHPSTLKDIKSAHPEVNWYQFTPKKSEKSSIPEQRNFGIQHSSGDIIVFIDANCIPVEGWLERLASPLLTGEEDITAGPFGSVDTSKRTINVGSSPHQYLTCSGTGNLAFKKIVWGKVGGFDETFLYGSDIDFTWRCIDAGYQIRSISDAGVSHDWGGKTENIRRQFKYGAARANLLIKHPQRAMGQLFGETSFILIYSAWIFCMPLTFIFPWYPLSIGILLIKNIGHKPFKTILMNFVYTVGFHRQILHRVIN